MTPFFRSIQSIRNDRELPALGDERFRMVATQAAMIPKKKSEQEHFSQLFSCPRIK